MTVRLVKSDVMGLSKHVEPASVQLIVCSPPRWTPGKCRFRGFADWKLGQKCPFGSEKLVEDYVAHLLEILCVLFLLLKRDGLVLLHLGDGEGQNIPSRVECALIFMGLAVHKRVIWIRKGRHQSILRISLVPIPDSSPELPPSEVITDGSDAEYNHSDFGVDPLFFPKWGIARYTNPGDLVLDPMAGSGTTGVAAGELGRDCVLGDIGYQDVQAQRCLAWLGAKSD